MSSYLINKPGWNEQKFPVKLALIDIILQKPDVVILDEVFNGLDSDSVHKVQKLLKGGGICAKVVD